MSTVVRCASACGLVAALLGPAGCFYTTAINERPRAQISVGAGPYFPGTAILFHAQATFDDEDGPLECRWSAEHCSDEGCTDSAPIPDQDPMLLDCSAPFEVVPPTGETAHRPIQVRLEVTDERGALFATSEIIRIGNRDPAIQVQMRAASVADHAVVDIPVEVAVQPSDPDQDAVALSWRLIKPVGAAAAVELAETDHDHVQSFRPDVPGVWQVEVGGDDGFAQTTAVGTIVVAEDAPPCVDLTSPSADEARLVLRRSDGPRPFSILRVGDDLDPFPRPADVEPLLGEPSFAWHLASPDTGGLLVPVAGADGAELVIDPSVYAPGDSIDVRVEVTDRVERTSPCDPDAPTCSLGGNQCYQRIGWAVEIR